MKTDPATADKAADAPQGVIHPRLLKLASVATLLGVSPATIERLHAAGNMPMPVKLCRDLLWDVNELNAWIDYARKCGGKPPARKEWAPLYEQLVKCGRN